MASRQLRLSNLVQIQEHHSLTESIIVDNILVIEIIIVTVVDRNISRHRTNQTMANVATVEETDTNLKKIALLAIGSATIAAEMDTMHQCAALERLTDKVAIRVTIPLTVKIKLHQFALVDTVIVVNRLNSRN